MDSPAIEVVRTFAGPRIVCGNTRLFTTKETKLLWCSQPFFGFEDGGSKWLLRDQDLGGNRVQDTMDGRTGDVDSVILGASTGLPANYASQNTLADVRGFADELLADYDLADEDWGASIKAEWVWSGGAAVKSWSVAFSGKPMAFWVEAAVTFPAVTKQRVIYRFGSLINGGFLSEEMSALPDSVKWRGRIVKRNYSNGAYLAEIDTFEVEPGDPVDDGFDNLNVYSEPVSLDAPADLNTEIIPEGTPAGAIADLLVAGFPPHRELRKAGFCQYTPPGAVPTIYKTETASGSFAGNGVEDPARSYSGANSYIGASFEAGNVFALTHWTTEMSDDVPQRYASGPFFDQQYRFGTPGQRRLALISRTETQRVWERTVQTEGGPVVDRLEFNLSEELTTSAFRAEIDDLVEDYEANAPLESVFFSSYYHPPYMAAVRLLATDETAYERKKSRLVFRLRPEQALVEPPTYPANLALTLRWREVTVAPDGATSAEDKEEALTLLAGTSQIDRALAVFDVAGDGRLWITDVSCDQAIELPQPVWLARG